MFSGVKYWNLFGILIASEIFLFAPPLYAGCDQYLLAAARGGVSRIADVLRLWKASFTAQKQGLHTYFTLKPRARKLSKQLHLNESDFKGDSDSEVQAFLTRAGRELNVRGLSPVALLKDEASNKRVLTYLNILERRARDRNIEIKWQEVEFAEPEINWDGEISISLDLYLGNNPISECLMAIEHEMGHHPEIFLNSRTISREDFIRGHLDEYLKDELRVRLNERTIRNDLQKIGLPVPLSTISDLSRKLWSEEDKGASPDQLFEIVRKKYDDVAKRALSAGWQLLYFEADVGELRRIVQFENDSEFKLAFQRLFDSSLLFKELTRRQKHRYLDDLIETVSSETENARALAHFETVRSEIANSPK
jgi:hypothetical protein